jgi:hypothetical protein
MRSYQLVRSGGLIGYILRMNSPSPGRRSLVERLLGPRVAHIVDSQWLQIAGLF